MLSVMMTTMTRTLVMNKTIMMVVMVMMRCWMRMKDDMGEDDHRDGGEGCEGWLKW